MLNPESVEKISNGDIRISFSSENDDDVVSITLKPSEAHYLARSIINLTCYRATLRERG